MLLAGFVKVATVKPKYEVADVFRQYGDVYRRRYPVSWEQHRAMVDIMNCRTATLGGYVEQCNVCERLRISYCSCKNRNCPKCQGFEKAQWLVRQEVKLLPTHYFHVVFTTDHLINDLARRNREEVYNLLFRTAARVLHEYGQKYLGGEIGFTMVLHTWSQTLTEHIHLHCIVTGGALQETEEGVKWRASAPDFLFPVKALSRDFRDRFCEGLVRLARRGRLEGVTEEEVAGLVKRMLAKRWEVYIKRAPEDVKSLCEYLARYTYHIAISNHRIVLIADGRVSFTYRDNRDGGKEKVMSLPALEFMRRFLQHVLPARFVRIRHYGLHHSAKREALEECRGLMGLPREVPEASKLVLSEWVESVVGVDPRVCPFCGEGRMVVRSEFGPVAPWKQGLMMMLGIAVRGEVPG